MTTSWPTMPLSGQAITLVSTCGHGIHLGTILVMVGMAAGMIHGIHLIIAAGVMDGTTLGITAIMVGTILGTILIMVTMAIMAIPIGEVVDTILVAVVAAMPIITTLALALSALTVLLMLIIMAMPCQIVVVVHPAFVIVPAE